MFGMESHPTVSEHDTDLVTQMPHFLPATDTAILAAAAAAAAAALPRTAKTNNNRKSDNTIQGRTQKLCLNPGPESNGFQGFGCLRYRSR